MNQRYRAHDQDAVERIYDLRTPLMVIKSVVTMFDRYWDRIDVDKRRDLLKIALDEIAVLDRQIESLADDRQIRLNESGEDGER
jgi:K+-sensing histidine kinase KdpD